MSMTFKYPKTPTYCRGYIYAMEDAQFKFKDACYQGPVLLEAQKQAFELAEAANKGTGSWVSEMNGSAQAWADIEAFVVEFQIGWNKEMFFDFLCLRIAMAHCHSDAVE